MAGSGWRRSAGRLRTLRVLLRDTNRALRDVRDVLNCDPDVSSTVEDINEQCSRPTALVILGTSPDAKARLVHCILGRRLLPDPLPRGCRWLRIQYGSSTQVHLTLGTSEFELVEELECNRQPWDTLPLQDILRQDSNDLTTMLEIELNNSFLKDGLRIIIPPDLETDSGQTSLHGLKELYSDFYQKRDSILRNYSPIYLYALDRYGRNIFNEPINKMSVSRSDDDFWATFDLYNVTKVDIVKKIYPVVWKESCEPAVFSVENCLDLHQIKEINSSSQVLFVLFSDSLSEDRRMEVNEATESTESPYRSEELPESDRDLLKDGIAATKSLDRKALEIRSQEEKTAFLNELLDQWEVASISAKHRAKSQWLILDDSDIFKNIDKTDTQRKRDPVVRTVKSRTVLINNVLKFATECVQNCILEHFSVLSEIHVKVLQELILSSFDLARELQVVPKKIQYVAKQEQYLYETINAKFSEGDKKQELVQIMQEVLQEMKYEIHNMDWSVDDLPCHQDRQFMISNSIFYTPRKSPNKAIRLSQINRPQSSTRNENDLDEADSCHLVDNEEDNVSLSDGEEALSYDSFNIDDYDVVMSNEESFGASQSYIDYFKSTRQPLSGTIPIANETESLPLSPSFSGRSTVSTCSNTTLSTKQASLDVQRTVLSKLSHKISVKLVKFVDCLKDTYFGTLQRCLESLELCCREELGGRPASEAMRQVVSAADRIDLQPCASFSLLRSLLDSIRRLFYRLRVVTGEAESACCALSPIWRRQVALHTLASLSTHKLARLISEQIVERLSVAHGRYQAALTSLDTALTARLHNTEDVKLTIRKKYAPLFARLCLESTSMCDLLMYGVPDLGREIGRGQYGVVYAVRGSWAGTTPVAAKSVLPADDRHYHELAMEFFYTRSIPSHPRIVRLLGSLVQRGGGGCVSVTLVSERWARDLHTAVRAGLSFAQRMRVSCDIVEGIRHLHSLGLVHRDIKLKNVLLNNENRAALSDLGFCAAGALVSGSLVGTPVHMAPELLAGRYQSAVDVYAFGILFWYLCAGSIRLPAAFETFQNKEQLWSKVKRGLRPERLPQFSDECWDIMQSCWATEPCQRALLGDIQPRLEAVLRAALIEDEPGPIFTQRNSLSEDDSLNMTGLDD
ncbi:dual serine/threonine and tyrosine protein kinase-like [Pieris brassicae]|uniref:dual serine/threonine and tyrosine protein kinase-like n=1 Tax=Pieris brassicae TaxID=7116 RepID=UPI001E662108|nr:dual serine/threonine and tyrosine protein kinase-like [Pieris brassicae]XP_045525460.1 dual serine/threonine and tyrosine protein kinase-like [Pieris brassicae]XP_045525461.1 dual serine/threonine and tyrosine protein kinase-like [Pieris brassicae]XP_045525462.1 dual serine/threonine and tyrosine protein kinase-like [Pieris brassicae]